MKKLFSMFLSLALATTCLAPAAEAQNYGRLLQAGVKGLQALSISDSQVQDYVRQYIASLDAQSQVAPANSPYTLRLDTIVSGITQVDGIPLNFKVYITKDVNAFACADGSVRVYSGLMDLMTNDEVLGVIGHEIGHVAHKDTKKAFKEALTSSALRDVLGSAGGVVGALSDSQLGAIGEVLLSKGYSRKQETQADDYAYAYLKSRGKNPLTMAEAFKKLDTMSGGSSSSALMKAFSDHPDTKKRIANIEKQAGKDGYTYAQLNAPKPKTDVSAQSVTTSATSKSSTSVSSSSSTTKSSGSTKKSTKKSSKKSSKKTSKNSKKK